MANVIHFHEYGNMKYKKILRKNVNLTNAKVGSKKSQDVNFTTFKAQIAAVGTHSIGYINTSAIFQNDLQHSILENLL